MAKVQSWTREKSGEMTPGNTVAIPGGLPQAFRYLAGLDWDEFQRGLGQVKAAGFRVNAGEVTVMIQAKGGKNNG